VLAQFPDSPVRVITKGNLRTKEQLLQVLESAREDGSATHAGGTANTILVHTLVDARLRQELIVLAEQYHVPAIDLMGELIAWLQEKLGRGSLERPGLYRQLNRDYFERVAAIEYTMEHDDGKNPREWKEADILLVGPSRVGKTPLSLYLSVLGWKIANVPFVPEISLPRQIEEIDRRRIIGLMIEPGQLLEHRQKRQSRLGVPGPSAYTDPTRIYDEIESARQFFRRKGYTIINVTDKPIESSADEVIDHLTRLLR
jgi:regulator of PEP synthase PpsR (kinase-PPPase family)